MRNKVVIQRGNHLIIDGAPSQTPDDGEGSAGCCACTGTTAQFVLPPVGQSVTVFVEGTEALLPGATVLVEDGGYLLVVSIDSGGLSFVASNPGYPENLEPGALVLAGASVCITGSRGPAGEPGDDGDDGDPGNDGVTPYSCATNSIALTAVGSNSYMTFTGLDSTWMLVGQYLYGTDQGPSGGLGIFKVISKPSVMSVQVESVFLEFGAPVGQNVSPCFVPSGSPGQTGRNPYTRTTATFVQPGVGQWVDVDVEQTAFLTPGLFVFVEGGGTYEVITINSATQVELENTGLTGNAAPAAQIPLNSLVTTTGAPGADGTGFEAANASIYRQANTGSLALTQTAQTLGNWTNEHVSPLGLNTYLVQGAIGVPAGEPSARYMIAWSGSAYAESTVASTGVVRIFLAVNNVEIPGTSTDITLPAQDNIIGFGGRPLLRDLVASDEVSVRVVSSVQSGVTLYVPYATLMVKRVDGAGAAGAGLVAMGAWSAVESYTALDVVSYNGSSYIAIASSLNQTPLTGGNTLNAAYWMVNAEQGEDGTPGTNGSNGSNGINAFSTSSVSFSSPALNGVGTLTAANCQWALMGQKVFLSNTAGNVSGYFRVNSDGTSTNVSLLNEDASNVGKTFGIGSKISPAGETGAAGTPGASGGSATYTEFWVPDTGGIWEDTTVLAGCQKGPIFRIGTTLYQFGGHNGTAFSARIFTAPYDATGTTPTWTDTGVNLPVTIGAGRVALIGTTLYIFGSKTDVGSNATAILSAPVSTPLVWTNTNTTHGTTIRNNGPLVVANGKIAILGGHTGSVGQTSARWTLTSTPTSGWADAATYGTAIWEQGAALVGGRIYSYGGINQTTTVHSVTENYWATAVSGWNTSPAPLPSTVNGSPDAFHLGSETVLIGAASSNKIVTVGNVGSLGVVAAIDSSPTSYNIGYPYGASWIGGDGRIYYVQTDTTAGQARKIIRSGRRKVFALTDEVTAANAIGPYQGFSARLADGTPTAVSMHIRMGNPPWFTDRRTAY